jgi:hypothetical protein
VLRDIVVAGQVGAVGSESSVIATGGFIVESSRSGGEGGETAGFSIAAEAFGEVQEPSAEELDSGSAAEAPQYDVHVVTYDPAYSHCFGNISSTVTSTFITDANGARFSSSIAPC